MKKIVAVMVFAVLLLIFGACKNGKTKPVSGAKVKTEGADTSASSEEQNEQNEKSGFKIGVVYPGDPSDESGCSYTHERGITSMTEALGLGEGSVIRKINVDENDADAVEASVRECVSEGCGIIFAVSSDYAPVTKALAKEFPEVYFCNVGVYETGTENFAGYYGRIYQAQYLSGIAAGMKTQSGLIGYVAAKGLENSAVTCGIDAFAMGVERVNTEAKVYLKVTESPTDGELARAAAQELMDMGCDVIAQQVESLAPLLAAEERGVWGCGYGSDMADYAPEAFLASPVWNWGIYYTRTVKAVLEGKWDSAPYYAGLDNGIVCLSPLSKNCADGTKEAVNEAENEILGGKDVFTGAMTQGPITDNAGNVICPAEGALEDTAIIGGINWYYRNIIAVE